MDRREGEARLETDDGDGSLELTPQKHIHNVSDERSAMACLHREKPTTIGTG